MDRTKALKYCCEPMSRPGAGSILPATVVWYLVGGTTKNLPKMLQDPRKNHVAVSLGLRSVELGQLIS